MSTMPVTGARTMAANSPAMPKMTKFPVAVSRPSRWAPWLKELPTTAPSTSRGRKMPPGTPAPKLAMEKRNFTANSTSSP